MIEGITSTITSMMKSKTMTRRRQNVWVPTLEKYIMIIMISIIFHLKLDNDEKEAKCLGPTTAPPLCGLSR